MEFFVLDSNTVRMFGWLCPKDIAEYFDEDTFGIGAIENGEPAGILLGKVRERTISLDWIYVAPKFSGKGVGRQLIQRLTNSMARIDEIDEIFVTCTADQMVLGFLVACGFRMHTQGGAVEYVTTLADMIEIPYRNTNEIQPFTEVSERGLKQFHQMLYQNPEMDCGATLPIMPEDYAPQSMVYEEDGEIRGLILTQCKMDEITFPYVYVRKGSEVMLGKMISVVAQQLKEKCDLQQKLVFGLLNQESIVLAEKIFPNGRKNAIYSGYLRG